MLMEFEVVDGGFCQTPVGAARISCKLIDIT